MMCPLLHYVLVIMNTTRFLSSISFRIMSAGDPTGRAFYGVGLGQLACWHCGFGSRRGHGCLSIVSVACCQAEVSASG